VHRKAVSLAQKARWAKAQRAHLNIGRKEGQRRSGEAHRPRSRQKENRGGTKGEMGEGAGGEEGSCELGGRLSCFKSIARCQFVLYLTCNSEAQK
jgi:hypothetical protein